MWAMFWLLMFMLIPVWIPMSAVTVGALVDAVRAPRRRAVTYVETSRGHGVATDVA